MKKKSIFGAFAVVFLLAVIFTVFSSGQSKENSANSHNDEVSAHPALTVSLIQPKMETLPIAINANGNIVAWQEAIISSDMPDLRLKEVRVNVGDKVHAGQVLAVFDAEPVRADVAQAKASLAEAQAMYTQARSDAARVRQLQGTGALSQQEISQYISSEKSALARVNAAKAVLAAQSLRLKRTQVFAPDSGVISARNATVGTVIGVGGELFRLVRQGRLEWQAELTAAELGKISAGTEADITLVGGERVLGKVRMVAPTVNEKTRIGLIYVDLDHHELARAGMFAKGILKVGESNTLTVPSQAVVAREAFDYVFVLDKDGKHVRQLKVLTGRRFGNRVEIQQGLDKSAQVVIAGSGFLNDGDLVRISNEKVVVASETATGNGV